MVGFAGAAPLTFNHNHVYIYGADGRLWESLALLQQTRYLLRLHGCIWLCPKWHHLPHRHSCPEEIYNSFKADTCGYTQRHTQTHTPHHNSKHHFDGCIVEIKYFQAPSILWVSRRRGKGWINHVNVFQVLQKSRHLTVNTQSQPLFHCRRISCHLDKGGPPRRSQRSGPGSHSSAGCCEQPGSCGPRSAPPGSTCP